MSKEYTEAGCVAKLTKLGCKFSGMKTFTVPRAKIGINSLGMVDYLVNECKMVAQYV